MEYIRRLKRLSGITESIGGEYDEEDEYIVEHYTHPKNSQPHVFVGDRYAVIDEIKELLEDNGVDFAAIVIKPKANIKDQ